MLLISEGRDRISTNLRCCCCYFCSHFCLIPSAVERPGTENSLTRRMVNCKEPSLMCPSLHTILKPISSTHCTVVRMEKLCRYCSTVVLYSDSDYFNTVIVVVAQLCVLYICFFMDYKTASVDKLWRISI